MSSTYALVRNTYSRSPPTAYAPTEVLTSTPAPSRPSSTTTRGRPRHHQPSSANAEKTPTSAFFTLRKAEKDRRGGYPPERICSSSSSSLAPSDSISQPGCYQHDENVSRARYAYPRGHEAEWRARTGFRCEWEVPYYEVENDFGGNYLVDVVPGEGMEGR
ncbi:hypothetical protein EJ03DRAFT_350622 [Teratosphaeria nubilosa]|uniref:Uncharacterized protein n=1 Tax=Teratosphaeria nubilosa TaxID=161662 RepID=A0A6G1LCI3_9PEZI|nr:hypothetical protein EJ03DRAFT_350622 [Teratosphaeria nubilosa]